MDGRLENIESQVYKQNDRINCVEKSLKLIHARNKSEYVSSGDKAAASHGQSRKENFINRVKAELIGSGERKDDQLDFMANNVTGVCTEEENSRTKLRKNNSFNGKPSPRPFMTRRSPHTVPSDKGWLLQIFFHLCFEEIREYSLAFKNDTYDSQYNIFYIGQEYFNMTLPKFSILSRKH